MAVLTAHYNANKTLVRESSIFQEAKKNLSITLSQWNFSHTLLVALCECDSVSICVFVYLAEARSLVQGKRHKAVLKTDPCTQKH